jgi:hypothetical protein
MIKSFDKSGEFKLKYTMPLNGNIKTRKIHSRDYSN